MSSGVQQRHDLPVVGEPARVSFREDQPPLGEDVELAFAAWYRLGFETLACQLGRETRGPCVVPASGRAVKDLDAHRADASGALDA